MKSIQIILIVLITVLEVLKSFVSIDLSMLIFIIGILFLLLSVKDVSGGFKKPVGVFLIVGGLLLIYNGAGIIAWRQAITSMLNIVGILVIMQLFSIPIAAGDYGRALEIVMRRFSNSPGKLFAIISLLTNIFGSFLLFGTIPVMLSLVQEAVFKFINQPERFISNAITRSYSLVVLWTPTAVNIVIVSSITGAGWQQLAVPGLCVGAIGLIFSNALESINMKHYAKNIAQFDAVMVVECQYRQSIHKLYHIVLVVVCLISLVIYFGYINIGSNTEQVMLAGLATAFIWILYTCRRSSMYIHWYNYFNRDVLRMLDLSVMFIAISVFSKGIEVAGILDVLVPVLNYIYGYIGTLIVLAITLLIVALAYIGVHPFGAMVVIGNMVMAMNLPVPAVIIALGILLGASISYVLSPFAGIVLTMSKFMNVPAGTVSLKWNGWFSFGYFILAMLFIYSYWYWIL